MRRLIGTCILMLLCGGVFSAQDLGTIVGTGDSSVQSLNIIGNKNHTFTYIFNEAISSEVVLRVEGSLDDYSVSATDSTWFPVANIPDVTANTVITNADLVGGLAYRDNYPNIAIRKFRIRQISGDTNTASILYEGN